jgi:hypothetical protein
MSIELHISADGPKEFANQLLGVLGALAFAGGKTFVSGAPETFAPAAQSEQPAQEDLSDEVASKLGSAPAPAEQPKRTRRTKAEMEAAARAEQPAEQSAPTEAVEATPAEAVAEPVPEGEEMPEPISIETLWNKLDRVIKEVNTPTAAKILAKFGVRKVRDLTDEQKPKFLADVDKAGAIIDSVPGEQRASDIAKALGL